MSEQERRSAKDLFNKVRLLPPDERGAYLDRACAADAALRREVEQLLADYEAAGSFLDSPTMPLNQGKGDGDATSNTEPRGDSREFPGAIIDRYKILQLIGEGGFGRVYMAEQTEPVVRRVALKVIKLGMDTRQVIARFEAERQALAMMDHANIAKVLDAGATSEGRPYFVMELVKGDPITEYCDRNNLSVPDRLKLFAQVCRAVQHAHQKGIIHRDIKPSNVLITIADGRPVPKVIDFGIAKATNARLTEKTLFTELRQLIGTPQYMSPEQAEASGVDIDTRSDIYSLGVLLYELLTGTTPFDANRLRSAAFGEIQRIIREEEPAKPSTRLSTLETLPSVAAHRHTEPKRLSASIRGDLDWIVMKTLEKDRTRRYETADALALDVQRHLNDEPVIAGPPSRTYRVRKFVRRHKVGVAASVAIALALVLGVIGTSAGMTWALNERAEAITARQAEAEQRVIAEERTTEAIAARDEAEQRQKETQKVSDFQASMWRDIDIELMGLRLREDVLNEARLAWERSRFDEEEIEQRSEDLERLVAGTNFTNAAVKSVDRNVLARALEAIADEFDDVPLVQATLLQTVAETYQELGLYDAATLPLERALTIRRDMLGDEHPQTLASIRVKGRLLLNNDNIAEAEPYLLGVLDTTRRVLGQDHPETFKAIHNVGVLFRHKEEFEEAEHYLSEALEIKQRVLGPEHPRTLSSMNSLAVVWGRQGRQSEAEECYRSVLESYRRKFGDQHVHTLSLMSNLAGVLTDRGALIEAQQYCQEALVGRRRVLGDDHPNTLSSIHQMGALLMAQGMSDKAVPYFRWVLESYRRILGNEHLDTMAALSAVGAVLMNQGRFIEAEPYLREGLEVSRRVLGNEHRTTALSINIMGHLLLHQGLLAEAEAYFREALEIRRRTLKPDHIATLGSLGDLAQVLTRQGHHIEAEPYQREVLESARRVLGDEHPNTLMAVMNMGGLLQNLGELVEAEVYFREAMEGNRRILGNDHPTTLIAISNVGANLLLQGRLDEAEGYIVEALEGRRLRLGNDHPYTLISIGWMGALLRDLSRLEEAHHHGAEAVSTARRVLPPGHWRTATFLGGHARTLAAMKRFAEAEERFLQAQQIFETALGPAHERTVGNIRHIADLYDAWHEHEPDAGHDVKAAEWRARLIE